MIVCRRIWKTAILAQMRYWSYIFLERLRKTTNNVNGNSRSSSKDSNSLCLEYKAKSLPFVSNFWVYGLKTVCDRRTIGILLFLNEKITSCYCREDCEISLASELSELQTRPNNLYMPTRIQNQNLYISTRIHNWKKYKPTKIQNQNLYFLQNTKTNSTYDYNNISPNSTYAYKNTKIISTNSYQNTTARST
jgi:hypothetical protein